MNQQLIEDLVTLKKFYQLQHSEMEQKKVHAREQLTHVNALLVDEIVESQRFVENLIELRNHYQGVLQECVSKASYAIEQISHINALLADQLVQQHNQQPISVQASTISENPALAEAGEIASQESPTQEDELDQGAGAVEVDEASGANEVEEGDKQQEVDELGEVAQPNEPEESNDVSSHSESASPSTTPMLPQYENLTKFEAVESILREKTGSILHVDWIIRALHGKLLENGVRAERGRMSQILIDGAKKELWDKVPGESRCYTIDLDLVARNLEKNEKQRYESKNEPPKMLSAFLSLKLIDAVDFVLNENAGQILSTDFVAQQLYGFLSGQDLIKAKEIVARALWRGAEAKRWQRVPKQRGAYTLDLRLLKSEPRTS